MPKKLTHKDLTLREKIGQTVICLCETDKHIEMCGSLEKFLERYPIGGLFNNKGLVKGLLIGENPDFKNVVSTYNKYLKVPMFATADSGSFAKNEDVILPPQMALGAADNTDLAYKAGQFIAEDCKKTGINWIFWPVCDINMSKRSPVMDTRCVSDRWDLNTKIVSKEVEVLKKENIISCLKHYPGIPYNESIDSHLTAVDNETPMELWRETYGAMYKTLFKDNPPSIMTGHINLTDYQTEKVDGKYPVSTLSYELTTNLLRKELGFKGVTVTDALVMGGFCGNGSVDRCVESFLAGNDVLLWPAYEYIDEMEKRILNGEIDERLLDEAVDRILDLKSEYGILDMVENKSDADGDFFRNIAKEISENSLTLLNKFDGLLPLDTHKHKKVLIIGVTPDDAQYNDLCALKNEFEKYGCSVEMRRNIWSNDLEEIQDGYDLIMFALCRTSHRPIGPIDFWGDEAASIWASNCADVAKTVIVSFGSPYIYKYYNNSPVTYINTYSYSKPCLEATVKALFGEVDFKGKSPAELI